MPANVTPEYEKAEQRYRQASTDEQRLAALQDMLATIPKHKGTEKMQADIKRRLSQLRKEQQKSAHGKGPDPFHIPKSGAGQVVLLGPANTGKSSLLAVTTHAEARVADYPFSTLVPQPGMWVREEVPIELVDTPPLAPDHVVPGLMGMVHNADVACVVVEAGDAALDQADCTLNLLAARGVTLRSVPRQQLHVLSPGLRPGLILANKADLAPPPGLQALRELYTGQLEVLAVSARTGQGLDAWFKRLWELLGMIRIYAKQPGKAADLGKPFLLPMGSTVADLARLIHRDLPETMRYARLWGHARFEGQQVHRNEVLRDRDRVEIHE
jgi:hypothetical protein